MKYTRIITSTNLEVITKLTESGAGIGIIPGRVASLANIKKVAGAPEFDDEICLIYRVENKNIRMIQEFAEKVRRSF